MILENKLDANYSWCQLLVADYHLEYPLEGKCNLVWQPSNLEFMAEALGADQNVEEGIRNFSHALFGHVLEDRYPDYYDSQMNLWIVGGSLGECTAVFDNLAQALVGGPRGADDDTYDYWPNAFSMLTVLAMDLITLGASKSWIVSSVDRVVTTAIAVKGPAEDWEAGDILKAVPALELLEKDHAD